MLVCTFAERFLAGRIDENETEGDEDAEEGKRNTSSIQDYLLVEMGKSVELH